MPPLTHVPLRCNGTHLGKRLCGTVPPTTHVLPPCNVNPCWRRALWNSASYNPCASAVQWCTNLERDPAGQCLPRNPTATQHSGTRSQAKPSPIQCGRRGKEVGVFCAVLFGCGMPRGAIWSHKRIAEPPSGFLLLNFKKPQVHLGWFGSLVLVFNEDEPNHPTFFKSKINGFGWLSRWFDQGAKHDLSKTQHFLGVNLFIFRQNPNHPVFYEGFVRFCHRNHICM